MADTKLTSLTLANSGSITDVNSTIFYAVTASGNLKVTAKLMQEIFGRPLGVLLTNSNLMGTSGTVAISYQAAVYQGGDYWSSNSQTMIRFTDNRVTYARFGYGIRLASVANSIYILQIRQNNTSAIGLPVNNFIFNTNPTYAGFWSPPVPVSSGDYFELFITGTANTVSIDNRNWFAMEPIQFR